MSLLASAAFALSLMLALFAGTWGSFALAYQLPIRGIGKGLLIGLWAASWLAVVIAVTRGHALEVLGPVAAIVIALLNWRSEEHTSELQSLMRISYAVFCLKKKIITTISTLK